MKPEQHAKMIADANRGADAERALKVVAEAFEDVKKQLFEAWMASGARDEAGREKLWLSTTLLSRVQTVLENRVFNGQIAQRELSALQQAGEAKKFLGVTLP